MATHFRSMVLKGSRVLGAFLAACFLLSQAPCAAAAESLYPAWANFGGKIGNHDRYLGLLDVFVPVNQTPDSLWFTDLRLKDASGPDSEYNIGGGYRRIIDDTWILGVYGYYDNLRSTHENYFNQGTLGVEALTKEWDFRLNAYFPETREVLISSSSTATINISGNSITTTTTASEAWEKALPGFDAEVGYRLPLAQDIRVYAGGYYFNRSGGPTISGPRTRTEWRLEDVLGLKGTRLTVEGEFSYDQVRHDQVYAGLAIRIPFGPGAAAKSEKLEKGSLKARMIEPIHRDVDVVSGEAKSTTTTSNLPAINPATGEAYSDIYYAAATPVGEGDGSSKENAESLTDAINDAGQNGIVVALSSEGTYTGAGYVDLHKGQTLIGVGGTLQARAGSTTGPLASLAITNADPENTDSTVLDGWDTGCDYVLGLSDNNTVSDITIENADYDSIAATAWTGYNDGETEFGFTGGDIHLKNVTVRESGIDMEGDYGSALYVEGANDIVIEGSNFDHSYYENIYINGAHNVTITDTTFSNAEDDGAVLYDVTGDITLTNVTANANYGSGVYIETVDGKVTVSGSDLSSNEYSNLYIDNESSAEGGGDVKISSTSLSGSVESRGLEAYTIKSLTLTDVTANTNGDTNLYIEDIWGTNEEGHAASLHSVVANGSSSGGLYIYGANGGSILIDNAGAGGGSQFNSNSGTNIALYNTPLSGDVTIRDTEAQESGDYGVYIDGANDITVQNSTVTGTSGNISYQNCNSYNGAACEGGPF